MVTLEDLGSDFGEDYVLVKISRRDVNFSEEIKSRAQEKSKFKLIAWGNAINLCVRLALEACEETIPDYQIAQVNIGTQEGVEMRNGQTRPLSWIEIDLEKE